MSDVKWIKLIVGMFDGESFKRIKRAKIGGESYRDKLTAIWFELMDFAGKCNHAGMFINSNEIPYNSIDDIAMMIDRDTEEVQLCMQFYINAGMIEIIDDVYALSNWEKYQNTDQLEKIREQNRKRIASYRERQKQALIEDKSSETECNEECNEECNVTVTLRNGTDKNKIRIDKNRTDIERDNSDFDVFWNSYPRKIAKDKAKSAFDKHIKGKVELDVILKALDAQKKSAQWQRDGGQFIPHPATWINQHRWEDELPADTKSKQAASSATSRGTFTIDDYIRMTRGTYEIMGKSDEEINEKIEKIRRRYEETGVIGG